MERNLDFRIVQGRSAVELRRRGTPNTEPPLCVLQLGCQVRHEKPQTVSYVLRRDSILLGDISAMRFAFADGTVQACNVTEIHTQ
jgi:hypothetical protein